MNVDNATTTYRIEKLSKDLASMAEDFSETLDDARKLGGTMATLKLLELMRQVSYDCHDLDEIIEVAIKTLPNNTDSSPTEATLKGARALHGQLSNKLWKLAGLVTLQVQAAATQPPGATH
jgi:hypothetical protein